MPRHTTLDHTIVVRAWIEPHDPHPRARLVELGLDRELTAHGIEEIEEAFASLLRELFDTDDTGDADV